MSSVTKKNASPDREVKLVKLTIDGQEVEAEEGSSLFTAITWTGVELPAMCYHYSFSPFGSCGLCLVEVEGKKNNVRACTAKILPDMVVNTQTDKMVTAQKAAVEKHLKTHPLDCPVCDKDGQCELQDMAYDLEVYDIKDGKRKRIPEDTRSVVLDFNMERCILCGQCINVCKEVQLVDALCFYKKDKAKHVGGHGGVPLDCEFCGDCLAVCPVGAIVSKFSKYTFKPWQLKKTKTTCSFCADGCELILETKDREIKVVTSDLSYTNKFGFDVESGDGHGGICVRGRFGFDYVHNDDRLSTPLKKVDGQFEKLPWFTALLEIGQQLKKIKKLHGGSAIAGLITGRCTNEDAYVFQRLMRAVLGSNNMDTAARYGHMNSVLTLQKTLKVGGATVSHSELALSDAILMIGSDLSETNPITGLRVKASMAEFGGTLMVADTVESKMLKLASIPLQISRDSESAFIQALVKAVIDLDLTDKTFTESTPAAFITLKKAVSTLSNETLVLQTGIAWETIEEVAGKLANAKRGVLLWGEGISSVPQATKNIHLLIDLALVTGLTHKKGAGLFPLCEENNEQGTVDMGTVPEFLPGQIPFSDEAMRQSLATTWHTDLPSASEANLNRSLADIIEAAHRGEIKALYLVGENPLGSLPASMKVREALEKIDLIISQDPFINDSGELADYLLPAATFAEKDGHFTNIAGEVNRVTEAFDPRGEARPDWKVFVDLSKHLGHPIQYRSAEEISKEIGTVIPGYFDGSPKKANGEDYLKGAFLREVGGRYKAEPAASSEARKDVLALEQNLYHSGKLTLRDKNLMKIYAEAKLKISTADAERLGGLISGDPVILKSALGQLEVPVEVSEFLPQGLFQYPLHFNDPPVKDLMSAEVDSETKVITFRHTEVTIERSGTLDLRVITPELADQVTEPLSEDQKA